MCATNNLKKCLSLSHFIGVKKELVDESQRKSHCYIVKYQIIKWHNLQILFLRLAMLYD